MDYDEEVASAPRRREDPALMNGSAQFTDDFVNDDTLHAAILRSEYGHARIVDIDTSAAEAIDDVIGVFTAANLRDSDAPGWIHARASLRSLPAPASEITQRATEVPLLAAEKVRYVGEPVAVVVAADRYTAHTARDAIAVDYDRLPAVVSVADALADDAPVLHEAHGDNRALDWTFGDRKAVDDVVASADHSVELEIANQRLIPNALEPRASLAEFDAATESLTLRMSTQIPHRCRWRFAESLGIDEEQIRVIAPAVGGGFGSKGNRPYVEEPLSAWCAMQLGRPVSWTATRSESHQADHHGRDVAVRGELALAYDGTIQALRVHGEFNLGAYLGWFLTPAKNFHHQLSNIYQIPMIAGDIVGAFTNKTPIGPYRGPGTINAVMLLERLLDDAAAELNLDPAEIRRRNLIPPEAFPYETPVGAVYDSGRYAETFKKALEMVEYEALRYRQRRLREQGRYLGIGICGFTKKTGVGPSSGETCEVSFEENGGVTAYCGTADHGQGHTTTFSQILSAGLGVSSDAVSISEGDTDNLPAGIGTFASRSVAIGGSALIEAAEEIREQARRLAAQEFEASPEDVEFADGSFHLTGTPSRSSSIGELAERSYAIEDLPEGVEPGFETSTTYDPENITYPFGFHVAVVEVDPETGEIVFDRYVAVDDVGVQINPLLVRGQVLGGIAQGFGQALYEHAVYDTNGTLQTASFTDYAMPRSMHIPEIELSSTVTPCPHNRTGGKGAGENGTVGAAPAIVNAVMDALRPLEVEQLDPPLTQEAVWQAVRSAGGV